ncbi:MAG TPA: hypothetical protein VJG29_00505 [Candidatus Paceibacterota bacterium]
MLTILIGTYEGRRALRKKTLVHAGRAEDLSGSLPEVLRERALSTPLFEGPRTYMISGLAEEEFFEELVPVLAHSPHLFVCEEEKVLAKTKARLVKEGATLLDAPPEKQKERINVFALADALGNRDKKKMWVLLAVLLREGAKPEEVAGALHWQARSMLLAKTARSAEETKMKDFVFAKSLRYAKNFTEEELKDLSRSLVTLYHEAHRGRGQLELALERLVLSL